MPQTSKMKKVYSITEHGYDPRMTYREYNGSNAEQAMLCFLIKAMSYTDFWRRLSENEARHQCPGVAHIIIRHYHSLCSTCF